MCTQYCKEAIISKKCKELMKSTNKTNPKITKTNEVNLTKENNVHFVWWFKNDVGHPITHCIALTNLLSFKKKLVLLINQILSTV